MRSCVPANQRSRAKLKNLGVFFASRFFTANSDQQFQGSCPPTTTSENLPFHSFRVCAKFHNVSRLKVSRRVTGEAIFVGGLFTDFVVALHSVKSNAPNYEFQLSQ